MTTDFFSDPGYALALALQDDDKIIVAGFADSIVGDKGFRPDSLHAEWFVG